MNDNVAITSFYKGVKYSVQYNPRTWYNEYIKSLGKDIYGFVGTEQKEVDGKWIDTNDAIIFLRKKDNNKNFEFLFGERYFNKANKTIKWYRDFYSYQGFIQDLSIKNDKEFVWKVKWDISIDEDIFTINEFSIQKVLLSRNIQDERQMKSLIKNFTIYEYKNNHKWEYCNFFETPQEAIKCANLIVKNINKK